ncbi:MFS transporter [Planosporangium thailandense]|uniref:MFS transporter n=1 Tax=Planosporangium thailandense TaxID=765197 RepID=A0ABX0XTJ0_9ACTN|nr:MFS transporter [Planosporangium thailandense]NJC68554.1 MFS transporter [Planosporangium thailandense]
MLKRLLPTPGPVRVLTVCTLVNTAGNGLWLASSALYLTRVVGLSATQVGLGLTAASGVCLIASTPMGYLADRRGPRGVQVTFYAVLSVLSAAMLAVHSFASFVLLAALTALADAGQRGARGGLIAGTIPVTERVRARAYLRATTNVGISIGTTLAGVALAADTPTGYRLVIAGNAVSFAVAAIVATRLPAIDPQPAPRGPRLVALRDRPFLAYVALDGIMSMHFNIIDLVLPLWVATRTHAPRWLVAVILLVNTTMVVALQVRAARGTDDVDAAARAARGAGLFIGVACVIFAASAGVPAWAASALLLAGALVHVIGELRQSAAGWGISFGLAPAHAQGQYQATYSMGMQFGRMLAPAVLTWLALDLGLLGWLLMAALFVSVGAAVPGVVTRARRNRSQPEAAAAAPAAVS